MRTLKLALLAVMVPACAGAGPAAILSWNNLGMHCMDSDYSVFSVLPPYNTIEAQLIINGRLVTNGAGYRLTYEAVADPDGSFNSTSLGKGNYYSYVGAIYGANLAPDQGLAGWAMPGSSNVPQAMLFEQTNHPAAGVSTPVNWWRAEGIPLTPYDNALHKNPYPLMRLIAWNNANQPLATNDIVLPVSDEMDCRACHGSGTQAAAQPSAGWVWDGLPERDYRLNILRLHDERAFASQATLYAAALAARGFNAQGLYRSVTADAKPVLCAACHASEALGAPSYGSIPPLTASVHGFHAHVIDPFQKVSLDDAANRAACYRCHPGSTTRCLRGAMGGAIAANGSTEMQCQSCHGSMSQVGSTNRVGWFMEPACQSCHSGTATANSGQIRYTSAFTDTNGTVRIPANTTFATQPNIPAAGLSLYRFSAGHGGLQCEACHGSTHAEFPSTHRNDNLRNIALQGHAGVMSECTACHTNSPSTITGGPHGMHPVGQTWISTHPNLFESGQASVTQCQSCHGIDYRGTVLSRVQANRTLSAFGTQTFFRGAIIGCYTCHNGPGDDSGNLNAPPTVSNVVTNTTNDKSVAMTLPATGTGLTLRVISQPANGSVGLSGTLATYFPNPGFTGTDTFTFAAYDGAKNSNLGTVTVNVAQGPFSLGATAYVPPSNPAGWPAALTVVPAVTNTTAAPGFDWNFGDATPHSTEQYAAHTYATPGNYAWTVVTTISGVSVTNSGNIQITAPIGLSTVASGGLLTFSWPPTIADVLLETTTDLGSSTKWIPVTNAVGSGANFVTLPAPGSGNQFFRVRRPW